MEEEGLTSYRITPNFTRFKGAIYCVLYYNMFNFMQYIAF